MFWGDAYVIKYILNILTWYLLSLNTNDFKCLDVALHIIHSFFFFKYCNFEAIEMIGSTFHYATVTLRKTVVRITKNYWKRKCINLWLNGFKLAVTWNLINLLLSAYTEFHIDYWQIPTTQIPLCDMVAEGRWFNCNITQVLSNLFSEYNQLASSILFYSSIAKRLQIDWLQNLYL